MFALVTGGGGFLGSHMVEALLDRGDRVRCFGRRDYPLLRGRGADVVQGDIRDATAVGDAVRGVDVVFHTAAIAGIWGDWSDYHATNTVGTEHVISACWEHAIPRLVFTSSPSVTFDGKDQCGVDESAPYPTRWLCHYPHSKALAERAVLAAHGQHGLATCALRPHLIWGPRDTHLVPRLLQRAQAGQLRRIGNGKNLVDMVYVENAAVAHLQAADRLAIDSPVGGKAYFISQGEPVNCWDWINELLALDRQPPLNKSIAFQMAWVVGAALEGAYRFVGRKDEPRMTRFLAAQLATSHFFDIGAARRDFGYQPKVSTDEGMRRLGDWLDTDCLV